MVSTGQLLAFALASLILIVIPGPSVLFVVGRALAHGRGTALASVLGNAVRGRGGGHLRGRRAWAHVVQRSAVVFTAVKLAGGLYLVWLGGPGGAAAPRPGVGVRAGGGPAWRQAGGAGGIRGGRGQPQGQSFCSPRCCRGSSTARPVRCPVQMILLSLVSFAIALASDSAWSLVASTARSWFGRWPRRLELVGGAGGLAMIGVMGISVAAAGRKN